LIIYFQTDIFIIGKSSLINSLRGLPDVDPIVAEQHDELDSALTGETETTQKTRRYGYPIGHELEFVRFWDHPGCGTQNHPVETYFNDNVLYAYDCVLLVTAGGLGEYEQSIIEAARRYGTDVVIVVNKAELKVDSKIRRLPRNARPLNANDRRMLIQETINEAKESINNALNNIQHEQVPVFVVSAWKWYEYQTTGTIDDMEMAIRQLFEHLMNTALARRAP
jgi:GTPase Era involved in 16S rRNA processing